MRPGHQRWPGLIGKGCSGQPFTFSGSLPGAIVLRSHLALPVVDGEFTATLVADDRPRAVDRLSLGFGVCGGSASAASHVADRLPHGAVQSFSLADSETIRYLLRTTWRTMNSVMTSSAASGSIGIDHNPTRSP